MERTRYNKLCCLLLLSPSLIKDCLRIAFFSLLVSCLLSLFLAVSFYLERACSLSPMHCVYVCVLCMFMWEFLYIYIYLEVLFIIGLWGYDAA